MSTWDDFKIVDGVKLYRGECNLCGAEFWHKNPFKLQCGAETGHAKLRAAKRRANHPQRVPIPHRSFGDDWSGSWDNAVKTNEGFT